MDATQANVLVVDDEPQICSLITTALDDTGLRCRGVTDPVEALRLLEDGEYSVVVADIRMPGLTGLELLQRVQAGGLPCRVVLISGMATTENLAEALAGGAYDFIQKPFRASEIVRAVCRAADTGSPKDYLPTKAARAMALENEIKQASLDSIRALVHAVEAKDPYTRRHSEQVTHYAVSLADHLRLDADQRESIRIAALLHDVGKIGIPDHILTKSGPLTQAEFEQIKSHAPIGAEILRNISMFTTEAQLVRCHHERWDGAGYPQGLAGETIPLGARIINVADSVDAMLMQRTYKDAYPLDKVLAELDVCAGSHFDPEIARAASDWCQANVPKIIEAVPAA